MMDLRSVKLYFLVLVLNKLGVAQIYSSLS
jgi:hypothetical protein